ncbi:MAG: hypothetical protein WA821_23795, partial [Anaerolineales bacterium]
MSTSRPRLLTLFLSLLIFISTACASTAIVSTGSTDPQPNGDYILVTPNSAPSPTAFQPLPPTLTDLPTLPPLPTLTPIPSDTPIP